MESKQDETYAVPAEYRETQQDVLEEALELAGEYMDDHGMCIEDIDVALNNLRARYAAAGKVAVPREVGKAADEVRAAHRDLTWVLEEARDRYRMFGDRVGLWIITHQDQFAEAWNHGWYAEEDAE